MIFEHTISVCFSSSFFKYFIYLNGESSQLSPVKHGVSQGPVLGPLLFSICMFLFGNIIRKYVISFHCYAYDILKYI